MTQILNSLKQPAGFLIILFVVAGCAGQQAMTSARIMKDGTEMLYGKTSREQLFFDYPAWQKEYEDYLPDNTIIRELQQLDFGDQLFIFLGTWCADSRREVPRFFKILDHSGHDDPEIIQIWAVDRAKKLADNATDMYDIYFVPTFIFFKNGNEIGRIVESPELRLEDDIFTMLSQTR